jgi:hypothetical protein
LINLAQTALVILQFAEEKFMIPPALRRAAPSTRPALDLIALARLSPEVARRNLRALLAANPDHFGKLSASSFKAILKIENDTTYESLAGLSYILRAERLRAIIRINQQTGYSTGNSDRGSTEYVRFYLSYDGGTGWLDQGMRAFSVFDSPDPNPHDHGVTLRIRPKESLFSEYALPRVRAILSWNLMPPPRNPSWIPVWGDVAETEIRMAGSEFLVPETLLHEPNIDLNRDDAATLNGAMELPGQEHSLLAAVES